MSKVLLVEPHKILQQAIVLALFPEHDVEVKESVQGSGLNSLEDYELIIVDGAALREIEGLGSDAMKAFQACKVPTLWLEEEESQEIPKREKLLLLKKPIERHALQTTIAELLGSQRPRKAEPKFGPVRGHEQESFEFIELVDVVDEHTPQRREKKSSKRPK